VTVIEGRNLSTNQKNPAWEGVGRPIIEEKKPEELVQDREITGKAAAAEEGERRSTRTDSRKQPN